MASLMSQREDVERSLANGDLPRALDLSAALLDLDPTNADLLSLRAAALMTSGNVHAAVDLLAGPARAAGAPYVMLAALAMCERASGDLEGASGTFRAALAERPNDFVLRLAYAECLDMQHDVDAALVEYFQAVNVAQGLGRWLSDDSTAPAMRERVKHAMGVIDVGRLELFERVLQPHVDAFGRDSMVRVTEALQVYLGAQAAPERDPRQRPKFFWVPGLPRTPFFNRAQFPWYHALEAATAAIQDELHALLESQLELTPFLQIGSNGTDDEYLGGDPRSRSWDGFFFYRHGERLPEVHAACQKTSEALAGVPLTQIAAHAPEVLFSVLAQQTHIKPHHGVTNTRVVTHLPLLIPQGDCKLVVGGTEHAWQAGRCVTFDDTFLHEAWNRTDQRRVVLIFDTWNPYLTPEECIALKGLIEQIGDFNVRAGVR